MTYIEDPTGWPLAVSLAACLCEELERRGLPTPCTCAVVPGPMAILDSCGSCAETPSKNAPACGGQAWVRMTSQYASSSFPAPDQAASCSAPLAYVFEVGVARCLPTGKANAITGFTPPSLEEQVAASRLQFADAAAIHAAITCCMDNAEDENSYVLGQYTPLQMSGDCGGGFWTVTVWSM